MSAKALPKGSLILITGVNGYIGAHVAAQLLELGYRIRGTARDEKKVQLAATAFERFHDQFEGIVMGDMSTDGAFAEIVKGCDGVIHVASDISLGSDPNKVVTPTIKALESVLAASAAESKVKRFVYTSSSITTMDLASSSKKSTISASSWNEADTAVAWAPPPYTEDRAISVYAASKIGAEKAAWKFVEEKKPHFVLNTVLPSMTTGPLAFSGSNPSTSGWVGGLYKGDEQATQMMLGFPPGHMVDVRDIARLHVAALLETDVENKRLLAFSEKFNYSIFVDTFKKIDPKKQDYPASISSAIDNTEVEQDLSVELLKRAGRRGFIGLEESLRDQIASY